MSKDDIVEIIIVGGLMLIAVIIVVGAFIASLNGHLGTGAGDTLHDLIMSICTGLMGYVVGKKVQEKISEGEGSDVLGKQINDLMSRLGNAGKTNIELQNQIDELKREKERKK